ncbi:hypothetical protein ESA94_12845 [Lacibacter luteus]|uniref:DUF4843 domain-containing protein n=1 Tax=Lacibacter luteus TaxID=2508719 RepID=A0A4Q1CI13_9BACT|nr:hypothetical protein [Lacibacter luteus]RXK59930.1 hypothetical protein ESA94_12845 [Lacibacter luteus]
MKQIIYILIAITGMLAIASCEKKDYPMGLEEYEHHYYAIFVPNNNTAVTVTRSQTALLKFPVQFYSSFTRNYDAVARYAVTTAGISNPAVRGQDFDIVDKNGVVIPSADTSYNMIFSQAKQAMDTIYIKLLNNATPGARRMEIQMLENKTSQFYVDIFSTAFRRPVTIN